MPKRLGSHWRLLTGVVTAAAVCLVVVLLVVPSGPARAAGGVAPTPAATPREQAYQLLDAVVVPPGAESVSSLQPSSSDGATSDAFEQGSAFSEPVLACTSEIDVSRLWTVTGTPLAVATYIDSHPAVWISYPSVPGEVGDSEGVIAYTWDGTPTAPGWSRLDHAGENHVAITVAPTAEGETGIRVDAQIAPPGASCVNLG